jgi:ABC-type multidrug transport system ATPase subunit
MAGRGSDVAGHAAASDAIDQNGLRVLGVTKRWGKQTVLDAVHLEVEPGTTAWVGGRNGAGKTTLLRMVAGLVAADSGEIVLDGLRPDPDRRRYQRKIGFLSAGDRGLYARLSVQQNLDLWARLSFVPRGECRETIRRAIACFSLEALAEARADRLSLGQRQRVRLAIAFLHSPRLVLLDEPLNSLDDDGIAVLVTALVELTGRGGAAIWCSPGPPDVDQVTRGYVIEDARLERSR